MRGPDPGWPPLRKSHTTDLPNLEKILNTHGHSLCEYTTKSTDESIHLLMLEFGMTLATSRHSFIFFLPTAFQAPPSYQDGALDDVYFTFSPLPSITSTFHSSPLKQKQKLSFSQLM